MTTAIAGITFDTSNAKTAATFWAEVLGWTVADGGDETRASAGPAPARPGSRLGFQQVPEGKTVKNRLHLDLATDDFDHEVTRLTGLGATKLNEFRGGLHYATFADPDGNEFDLIDR